MSMTKYIMRILVMLNLIVKYRFLIWTVLLPSVVRSNLKTLNKEQQTTRCDTDVFLLFTAVFSKWRYLPPRCPSPSSPKHDARRDLVKFSPSATWLLCISPFHRSPTGPVTHLLVPHLAVTTFRSTTPLNRQINATIKSSHRLWWHSSKTVYMTSGIKDLMKSEGR